MKLFGMRNLQSLQFFLGVFCLAFICACSREPDTHKVSGTAKVRAPFATEGGGYGLHEIELSGVKSLYKLSGDYATFYVYPSISEGQLQGHQPRTRFLKSGDIYVPEDVLSQQLAVIYAHFQKFAALDRELGAGDVLTWPRKVGVLVRFRINGELSMNNAFYESRSDAMLVVPYTQDHLPIAVNAGILAHEHFHSLYFKLLEQQVFKDRTRARKKKKVDPAFEQMQEADESIENSKVQPEENSRSVTVELYYQLLSSGLNEGLADFWAWIYTGDPDFLRLSLPKEEKSRTLNLSEKDAENFVFPNSKIWKAELENWLKTPNELKTNRFFYRLGTKYAQLLKYFAGTVQSSRDISSLEARKIVGAGIIKTLPLLKEEWISFQKKGEYFEPYRFFTLLEKAMPDLKADEQRILQKIVTAAQTQNSAQIEVIR